jgi:hypothetical protein
MYEIGIIFMLPSVYTVYTSLLGILSLSIYCIRIKAFQTPHITFTLTGIGTDHTHVPRNAVLLSMKIPSKILPLRPDRHYEVTNNTTIHRIHHPIPFDVYLGF